MSTAPNKSRRRTLFLSGFVLFWLVAALWTVYKVKPEFWRDGYSYFQEAKARSAKGDMAGALTAMHKALGRDGGNVGYLVFGASLEEQAGHPDQAAAAYRRALAIKPGDPEASLGLAKLLLAAGKAQDATALLAALPPQALDPPLLERRAGLRAQYGDQAGAMADFERLLAASPDNPASLRGYAASALALKQWDKAAATLRRLQGAAKTAETKAWAREQLVIALRALGKPDEAFALLDAAPDPSNLALRAQLAMERQRFDQAKPLLEAVLKADPGNVTASNQLAIALRALGDLPGAYARFASVPGPDNLRARAELALELERFDEAAALLRELANSAPEDIAVREKLAYALDRAAQAGSAPAGAAAIAAQAGPPQANDAAAEKEYRQALASGQASQETRLRYAWLLLRAKRYADVLELLADSLTKDVREDVLELAANAAFLAGKFDRAIPLLTALAERQPKNAAIWRDLADAYDARREPAEAAKALDRYLQLRPDDQAARFKLAGLAARTGDTARAETLYRQLLEQDPDRTAVRLQLATLYESRRQFQKGIAVLAQGLDRSREPDPELLARLARLYGFAKASPEAIRTYDRLLALRGLPASLRASAHQALAEAFLNTGNPAQAEKHLQALRAFDSRNPTWLVLAARAAMLGHQPDQATKALERLSALRRLTPLEREWLAGQYRLSGQKAKALAQYEQLFGAGELRTATGLEALGDLRFDAGKFGPAVTAYQQADKAEASAKRALKIARAADKAGNKALARAAYERFLSTNPNDPDVLLEMARFGINRGDNARALALYDRVVAARGSKGLTLELALANLAAKRFDVAEKWARQAMAAGDGGFRAVLALVQALHLEGKTAEADRLLRAHKQEVMAQSEGRKWLGYVAVARDRQLQAFDIFDELARQEGSDQGKMWLWRGIAATRRGDYRRARESFDKARQYGLRVPETAPAQ